MIDYNFPQITHISDVLPHIAHREEFRITDKDWYTVVNYMVAFAETFDWDENDPHGSAIRRECRGLVFDSTTGDLLSRPYHKFFNIGERPELQVDKFDAYMSSHHIILEKLDGSMIRPIPIPGSDNYDFRLGTKAGVTDVAMNAEVWVAQHPNYAKFIRYIIEDQFTPIFEWCSRKNRIVVDYPEDRLVLTAIRTNRLGSYVPYGSMRSFAEDYDIDIVKVVDSTFNSATELVNAVRQWEGEEGVVVRFDAPRATAWMNKGHMVKSKTDPYIILHRSKEAISNEKNVIAATIDDKIDDLIPILTESDAKRLRDFQRAFWLGVDEVVNEMVDAYLADGVGIEGQREFALHFVSQQNRHWHPFMYGLRKGKDVKAMLIDSIKKALTSQTKVDKARWMFGNLDWNHAT